MTPAQRSYIIDTFLFFIAGGIIGVTGQYSTTGILDWHTLALAFAFGVGGFVRKWLSVNYGADSVAVPKRPDLPPPPTAPPADVLVDGHLLPPH